MIAMLLIFDLFLGCLFVIYVSYKSVTRPTQYSRGKEEHEDANVTHNPHLEAYLHWYDKFRDNLADQVSVKLAGEYNATKLEKLETKGVGIIATPLLNNKQWMYNNLLI